MIWAKKKPGNILEKDRALLDIRKFAATLRNKQWHHSLRIIQHKYLLFYSPRG
jgi:hypothetical protein